MALSKKLLAKTAKRMRKEVPKKKKEEKEEEPIRKTRMPQIKDIGQEVADVETYAEEEKTDSMDERVKQLKKEFESGDSDKRGALTAAVHQVIVL